MRFNRCTMTRHWLRMFCFFSSEFVSCRIPDDWVEPAYDIQLAAWVFCSSDLSKSWPNSNKTTNDGEHSQDCQRHPHRLRRLVRNVNVASVSMRIMSNCGTNMLTRLMMRTITG